ncbi:uncharacterized protein LOC117327175 [Pecten maximus]|uniref:uncharacterized protein LOC117327175 n=1 Tax=Pecten maximus TaxID=6579 RepID=UPI0014585F3E|nr:uncharacterized protein LOC117327175 [Pecten maximus]
MKTGIIDVQFDSENDKNGVTVGKIGKMAKKVRIKTDVDTIEGKEKKKKKRRRQGYPNLSQVQRSKEMGNETEDDSVDEDDGILPTIEGFDPRKRKVEEVPDIKNTRPGICDECKKRGLNSVDEYMQKTFKKYDTKDEHSNGHCIVCQGIGMNFNFLDSNSGSASMTYPRDFYDKFSRETKPPNIDSEPDHPRGSPGLPSIQEESKPAPIKLDPLATTGENVFEAARKGVLGRLTAESPKRRDALGRHITESPRREKDGSPLMDSGRKDVPTRYSPYMEKIKKDRYRNEVQYLDDSKKELLVRQFQFESPKLDLTGHGDIRNVSKRELDYRKDIKYSASFEPSKHRHSVQNRNRYVEYPLPTLNAYSFAPQEVSDEPECVPYNRGLKGGTIKKDPNPIHRERQELLQKQEKYSMYAVGSLGLVYGMPEHNKSLTDRSSIPETATSLSFDRPMQGNRPLSLLPAIEAQEKTIIIFFVWLEVGQFVFVLDLPDKNYRLSIYIYIYEVKRTIYGSMYVSLNINYAFTILFKRNEDWILVSLHVIFQRYLIE